MFPKMFNDLHYLFFNFTFLFQWIAMIFFCFHCLSIAWKIFECMSWFPIVFHCSFNDFQWFFNEIQWFSLVLNDGSFRSAETLRNSRRAFKVHNIVIAEEFATSIWYRRASGGLFPSPRFLPPPPFSKWTFNAGWHHDCQTNLSVSCPHLNTGIMGVRHISKDKCALWPVSYTHLTLPTKRIV